MTFDEQAHEAIKVKLDEVLDDLGERRDRERWLKTRREAKRRTGR